MMLVQDLQSYMQWLDELLEEESEPEPPLLSMDGDICMRVLPPITLGKGCSDCVEFKQT